MHIFRQRDYLHILYLFTFFNCIFMIKITFISKCLFGGRLHINLSPLKYLHLKMKCLSHKERDGNFPWGLPPPQKKNHNNKYLFLSLLRKKHRIIHVDKCIHSYAVTCTNFEHFNISMLRIHYET